jgi:hypothetical protein
MTGKLVESGRVVSRRRFCQCNSAAFTLLDL